MLELKRKEDKKLIFLKLRKTGGTTLSASILFPYCLKYNLSYIDAKGWKIRPESVPKKKFDMSFRHFPAYPEPWVKKWLHERIGNHKTITMIREPLSRVASWYNHINFYKGEVSFEEYIEKHHEPNHQSTWLGYDGSSKDFLSKEFDVVGLTERFDESMLIMKQVMGFRLEDILYIRQREGLPKQKAPETFTKEETTKIKELDSLDFELYEQALRLVDEKIKTIPDIENQLEYYLTALNDFSHPLWLKRGNFLIGYSEKSPWAKFTGHAGKIEELREVPS